MRSDFDVRLHCMSECMFVSGREHQLNRTLYPVPKKIHICSISIDQHVLTSILRNMKWKYQDHPTGNDTTLTVEQLRIGSGTDCDANHQQLLFLLPWLTALAPRFGKI